MKTLHLTPTLAKTLQETVLMCYGERIWAHHYLAKKGFCLSARKLASHTLMTESSY